MEMDMNRFRSNLFGGFHRGDVADYIEKLGNERSSLESKVYTLKKKLEEQETEKKRLQAEKDVLGKEVVRLSAELKAMQERESERVSQLEAQRQQLRGEVMRQTAEKLGELVNLMECASQDAAADAENARAQLEELCSGLEASADASGEVCRRLREAQREMLGEEAQG